MKYISNDGDELTISVPIEELRALLDVVNEFADGPYAISDEGWDEVMLFPRSIEEKLLTGLTSVIEQHDSTPSS